jgi:hypothetical protein
VSEVDDIEVEARGRRIRRICHFTPSRNLAQILTGSTGILATSKLRADERQVYAATDLERLDGHIGHICCSIEYPNAWYFEKARQKDVIFKDWVVLLIDARYLWAPGTKFCPRNAAAGYGREVTEGFAGFKRLFAEQTVGAYGQTYVRSTLTPPSCPTDEQAEVLVADAIGLSDIIGVAVRDPAQANNELIRLKLLGISNEAVKRLNFMVAPQFWDKRALSAMLKSGTPPGEKRI